MDPNLHLILYKKYLPNWVQKNNPIESEKQLTRVSPMDDNNNNTYILSGYYFVFIF